MSLKKFLFIRRFVIGIGIFTLCGAAFADAVQLITIGASLAFPQFAPWIMLAGPSIGEPVARRKSEELS